MRSIHLSSRQAGHLDTLHIWWGYESTFMMDKMYSFTNALSAAAVMPSLLPKETERNMKLSSVRSEAVLHVVPVCSHAIKVQNMRYLHYCGSISMSWRSLLLIQMAEECVRMGKHAGIIDQLNLYSLKCSHLDFVDNLDLWSLWVVCVWRRETHQSHSTVDFIPHD